MNRVIKYAVHAAAAALLSTGAGAKTIDFGGLSGVVDNSPFTGPYLEDGYSVSALDGGELGTGVYVGQDCCASPFLVVKIIPSGAIDVTRDGGSTFAFTSFDLLPLLADFVYTVSAWDGVGHLLYSLNGSANHDPFDNTFKTITGNGVALSRLRIGLAAKCSTCTGKILLDNIVLAEVDPVPEPAEWALMIAGFGLAGAATRRVRARISYALA